jgi:hypothetical protein
VRPLLRHRAALSEPRAPHLLHRHKAFQLMHRQWSEVLTAITAVIGLALRRALLRGERASLQRAVTPPRLQVL